MRWMSWWLCVLWVSGCSGASDGQTCLASDECQSRLCVVNLCRAPAADDDGDGLTNAQEHALGSHPDRVDTDGDGKDDGAEVGPNADEPHDSDGDGVPDLLESQLQDGDRDCLSDELDADNKIANTDAVLLAELACAAQGVCGAEGVKVFASCQVGVGILTCDYGAVPNYAADELCDGLDNDCDGMTDEGHSYQGFSVGQPCVGRGACGAGVVRCREGRAACSSNPDGDASQAKVETCDGLDNDCDGETDETFSLAGLPVGVPCLGKGECGVGKVLCSTSGEPVCSSDFGGEDSLAQPEVCNGLDDDCDGATDENITLDGVPIGGPCVAPGACGAGVVTCGDDGAVLCSTGPKGPDSRAVAELCNGLDDNCDGATDEGFAWQGAPLGAACVGYGQCGAGAVVCSKAGAAVCSSMPGAPGVEPTPELCDGLDNDCDGSTDEGLAWQGKALGMACVGLGACGAGVVECNSSGATTCSSHPDGSASKAKAETCNGLDDDCNGVTDDAVPVADAPSCSSQGVCGAVAGTPECVNGAWGCSFQGLVGYEAGDEVSCDLKDNDCDGQTDEGLKHAWAGQAAPLHWLGPTPRESAASAVSASEFCVAGGKDGSAQGAGTRLADDLWCLHIAKGTWRLVAQSAELARVGATLAPAPAGDGWWLWGGLNSTGVLQGPVHVSGQSGLVSALPWSPPPGRGRAFLFGSKLSYLREDLGAGALYHEWDSATSSWSAPGDPPGGARAAHSCQDTLGRRWAVLKATSSAPATMVMRDSQGQWKNLSLPSTAPKEVSHLRLLCEVVKGQVWLLGSQSNGSSGKYVLQRYTISSGDWSASTVVEVPQTFGAEVGSVGGTAVVAWGQGETKDSLRVWWTGAGGWSPLLKAPSHAVGATWSSGHLGVFRVGGVVLGHAGPSKEPAPWWHHDGDQWKLLTAPQETRLSPLVAQGVGDKLVVWGGAAQLPIAVTSLEAGVASAPGAFEVSVKSGAVKSLGLPLPSLRTDALTAQGHDLKGAVKTWVIGRLSANGPVQLWEVDVASSKVTSLWTHQGQGPSQLSGADLLWDGVTGRLLYIAAAGGLRAWGWKLGQGGSWSVIAHDVSLTDGPVVVMGAPSMGDVMAAVLPGLSGAQPALRRLDFSTSAWTPVSLVAPKWPTPARSWWRPKGQAAWILPTRTQEGRAYPAILGWKHTCAVAPSPSP